MGNFYGGAPGRDLTIAKSVITEQELTNIMIDDSYPIGTLVFWVGSNSTYEYGTVLSKAYNEWKNLGIKIAKGEDIEIFGIGKIPKVDGNDIDIDFKNYITNKTTPDNIREYKMRRNSALIGTWNDSSYYIIYNDADGNTTLEGLGGKEGVVFQFMSIGGITASNTTINDYTGLPKKGLDVGNNNLIEIFINHNDAYLDSEMALYKRQASIERQNGSLVWVENEKIIEKSINITVKKTEDTDGFKVYLENPPFPLTQSITLENSIRSFEGIPYCGGKSGNIPLDIYCLENGDDLKNVRKYIKKITSTSPTNNKVTITFDCDDKLFPNNEQKTYNFLIVDHA